MLYTQEQIFAMTIKEAKSALNLTESSFQVDGPISIKQHWEFIDSIANQLIWLEDHIHELKLQAAAEERAIA